MDRITKPRVVKDYDKLPSDTQNQIKLQYPFGFADHLVTYTNSRKEIVSALPFEAEDYYYLVRMTREEAHEIIENDDDYDDDGTLRDDFEMEGLETGEDVDEIEDVEDVPDEDEDDEDDDDY
ncbi:hypothetical protein PbJCM13498_08190 [Prolixibacter bellariivorans]|uniref:DNA primase n=1 Tax=Prolixibacter bellariivorans TaxID=314319 RepID=A0A5M4AWI9_9BACT|nr:hypothetical protein [Prolixibacter bellariivorans]GET31956.1 hypothetical protein PbJCM13498_08190 [Prolixibacter bellariivorans]